jgi:hypothetical protein
MVNASLEFFCSQIINVAHRYRMAAVLASLMPPCASRADVVKGLRSE